MPIESPNLADLGYERVRDLLVRQIPIVAPEWTDHNDSDPGITLIQLFSHLAEHIGYRLNRIPDKNYIEFLKLIGIRLRPAEAARTRLAFVIRKPETRSAFVISEGSLVRSTVGDVDGQPPLFETDLAVDAVPAQLAAVVTTTSTDLRNVRGTDPESAVPPDGEAYVRQRFSLAWDGKEPKLEDMPAEPVPILYSADEANHRSLWIGLAFNASVTAGFLGQRVTLTVQMDDDEQPSSEAQVICAAGAEPDDLGLPVEYRYYRPAGLGETAGSWRRFFPLSDTTMGWIRSGAIRFDVPAAMGPIPDDEWVDVRAEHIRTTEDICAEAAGTPTVVPDAIPHPLVGALTNPVDGTPDAVPISGWIEVRFVSGALPFSLRALSFNVAPATNARSVRNELLASGDNRPGQTVQLAFGNVLLDTLELAIEDPVDLLLHAWERVDDFDASGPDDRHYILDREAGQITFGDGFNGRPPATDMRIIALRYRHGGGEGGDVGVGLITETESVPTPVQAAVNIVAALGGKDAETLDEAKARAPRELKVLGQAVTPSDFEFLALRTPGLRVRRVEVVPLHKPYADPVADGPGLDMDTRVPGVISLVVVPDAEGLYPTPTEGMLRKVCEHMDGYRLVTTELYVVSPQYVRLFDITVIVTARPGYTRTLLRETIAAHLERRYHVLTGGEDGTGFPFGAVLHHSELIAAVFDVEGVARVESLEAWFDGYAPAPEGDPPPMQWRRSRLTPRRLTACPEDPVQDTDRLDLFADENLFVDTANLNVVVR